MSKWALVADMTTGLANALESYNKGQMDEVDKHLGIIDRMITAQKMGYDLELAKLKYQNQGITDPIEALKFKQAQDLYSAQMDQVKTIMEKEAIPYSEAYRRVIEPEKVTAGFGAVEKGAEVGAKKRITTPLGSPYDVKVQADVGKDITGIKQAEGDIRKLSYGLEKGTPEVLGEKELVEGQEAIKQAPIETNILKSENIIKKWDAFYAKDYKKARIDQLKAEAQMMNDQPGIKMATAWQNSVGKAASIRQEIAKLRTKMRTGEGDSYSAIIAQALGGDIPSLNDVAGNAEMTLMILEEEQRSLDSLASGFEGQMATKYPDFVNKKPIIYYHTLKSTLSPNDPEYKEIQRLRSHGFDARPIYESNRTGTSTEDIERSYLSPGNFNQQQKQIQPKPKVESQAGRGAKQTKPASKKNIISNKPVTADEIEKNIRKLEQK